MSSEPPEEPHLRSEPNILSPASPKPIHFPAPTNIPVLEMQTDVGFNQTEAHMNDPAMHNTEVRPDFWRDPSELAVPGDHASPYSTGGEAAVDNTTVTGETDGNQAAEAKVELADSEITAPNEDDPSQTTSILTSQTFGLNASEAEPVEQVQPSSDPSVPAGGLAGLSQVSAPFQIDSINEDGQTIAVQPSNSNVDVQALLDTLQTAPASTTPSAFTADAAPQAEEPNGASTLSPTSQFQKQHAQFDLAPQSSAAEGASSPLSASGFGSTASGLPPRPPPQEQPLIHPNYVHSQHIRDYHPHASNPAFQPHGRSGSQGNIGDPSTKNYVPPVHSPSSANEPQSNPYQASHNANVAVSSTPYAQSGQSMSAAGLGPSYTPNSGQNVGFAGSPQIMYGAQYPSQTNTPSDGRRERAFRPGEQPRPEDRPWDAEVQRKYDRFIEDERRYVSEGRWEQFPQGSRLFVGNLSSEKVTKRDIFHVFHTYGDLAQISIKQAYGFVQFLRTEDCNRALEMEQGTQIRDKKIHLEVSKPQKNRTQNVQRRSRSPPDNNRGRPGSNVDRYVSGGRGGGNNNNNRGGYGGYRSPSPRGYRDRQDDRYRRRSRSPDYNRGGRYRSPSPRREVEDDLPLPRRAPRDVPDVQIIVLDSLDRDFISWVEQAFSGRGVRVDVLLLSPRLSEAAVIRRQIVEGVVAVVKLTRQNQNTAKIGLQIFDRRQGANNVKFEEYEGLDPNTAVELVLRAKTTHGGAAHAPSGGYGGYGGPQYGSPSAPPSMQQNYPYGGGYGAQSYPQPPTNLGYPPSYNQPPSQAPPGGAPNVPPNLQHLITNLDPNNLQHLLSAMNTPQSANSANAYANPANPNSAAVVALQQNPQLAGYLQQQQQQAQAQGGSGAVNMQEILARLGTNQR